MGGAAVEVEKLGPSSIPIRFVRSCHGNPGRLNRRTKRGKSKNKSIFPKKSMEAIICFLSGTL